MPWTRLDLNDPVGAFTANKLAALGGEPDQCRALLRNAGVKDVPAPLNLKVPPYRFLNEGLVQIGVDAEVT